jgi:transcriptional regulator with XRE-family HTH domain
MIIDELNNKIDEKHIRQYQLAETMDVSNVTIHKWLSGKVRLKVDDLERIANYMGCEVVLVERDKDEE